MFCMGNNEQENAHEDSTAKKIENYIFKYEDLLGKGNFGSAYRGYDVNTGRQVAIKVIKMSSIKSKVS
jgi:serine/threonine protein kinase